MEDQLANLVDGVAAAKSRAALDSAVRQFAQAFDADYFALVTSRAEIIETVTNYPAEWQERYVNRQYDKLDPVCTTAKRLRTSFCWSLDGLHCSTAEEAVVVGEAAEFGLRGGVTIPVKLPFGSMGMLTLASSHGAVRVEFEKHIATCAVAIGLCSEALAHFRDVKSISGDTRLSLRQTQCLIWASHGKSSHEISRILGISESAVCFHIKEARRRLSARSVTHAVRKAFEAGLIS